MAVPLEKHSGILLSVRSRLSILSAVMMLSVAGLPSQQQTQPTAPPQQQTPPAPPASQSRGLTTVVLDPAHGGTDAGARGESGVLEKDLTLSLAKNLKVQLEAKGLRVVLTRDADQGPTLDERAARANAQSNSIFLSLHVASTGTLGTARVYFAPAPLAGALPQEKPPLVPWDEAQNTYAEQSQRLAELVQIQIGQKLRGSAEVPAAVAVRQLRSVAAPAIAIELSSVAVADRKPLDAALPALAEAVVKGVAAFQPLYAAGGR